MDITPRPKRNSQAKENLSISSNLCETIVKSEFKSKTIFKYVMDDYNQILRMGDNLVNVSPLSANDYKHTEWSFLKTETKDNSYIKIKSMNN